MSGVGFACTSTISENHVMIVHIVDGDHFIFFLFSSPLRFVEGKLFLRVFFRTSLLEASNRIPCFYHLFQGFKEVVVSNNSCFINSSFTAESLTEAEPMVDLGTKTIVWVLLGLFQRFLEYKVQPTKKYKI